MLCVGTSDDPRYGFRPEFQATSRNLPGWRGRVLAITTRAPARIICRHWGGGRISATSVAIDPSPRGGAGTALRPRNAPRGGQGAGQRLPLEQRELGDEGDAAAKTMNVGGASSPRRCVRDYGRAAGKRPRSGADRGHGDGERRCGRDLSGGIAHQRPTERGPNVRRLASGNPIVANADDANETVAN